MSLIVSIAVLIIIAVFAMDAGINAMKIAIGKLYFTLKEKLGKACFALKKI
jgi:hypothetical protein